jgi:NifU-like protein involved in Fe-S cluster formation
MEEAKQNAVDILKDIGYSEKAILFLFLQLNFGSIDNPDITAKYQSDCGDTLILYLNLNKDIIINAKYEYIGCTGLQVAASALTEMVKGLSLSKASKIDFDDIPNFLEGVPRSKHDRIHLALNTLAKGIEPYL